MNMANKEYVRIRLNHSKENRARGFYALINSGNTYSDKKDEFIVNRKNLGLLTKKKVSYDLITS